jgi:hypothetical protein
MSQSVADPAPRRIRWRAAFASVLSCALPLALLAVAHPAEGQEAPVVEAPAVAPAAPATAEELVAEVSERFEVLPTRQGLLLRPREEAGYRAIEVEDGEVAVDGETVEGEALDERLGAAAGPVRRLAAMGAGARALFGYGGAPPERTGDLEVELPEVPEVSEAPAAGEVPEAPEPPEPPRPPRRVEAGQRVAIASSVTVDEGEVAEVAVAIGGNVRVDGEVDQDAVAVGGSVRVDGKVGGEVVAVGGSVHLGPDADVDGDVTSVGGRVERAEGARVGGRVSEVAMTGAFFGPGWWDGGWGWEHAVNNRMERIGDVFGAVFCLIVLILLAGLVTVVARAPVERVAAKSAEDPWRALLAGLLILVLIGPAMLILVISVIGCLVIPVVVALLLVGLLLGITGASVTAGRWIEGRFGWQRKGLFVSALIGLTAIHLWTLLATGLDAVSGFLWVPSAILWVFGLALQFAAWTIGLGAVWLTRFGAGPAAAPAVLPPPPPPRGYVEPHTPPPPATPPPVRTDSIFTEPGPEPVEPEPPTPAPAEAEPHAEPAHEPDESGRREDTDRG